MDQATSKLKAYRSILVMRRKWKRDLIELLTSFKWRSICRYMFCLRRMSMCRFVASAYLGFSLPLIRLLYRRHGGK
ncbi:hypothetical protein BN2497_10831 [Janthinobacterium sp. CG23_2]|nr:hypothetical protein BN2497_10831 [Janthinobacterium sp. CG23_2]CUU31813.1 hypothetical protein BN3177_10831 [Janthinobacterium sp. CG23_2]